MNPIKLTLVLTALLVLQGCATAHTVTQSRNRLTQQRQSQALASLRMYGEPNEAPGVAVMLDVGEMMRPATLGESVSHAPKSHLLLSLGIDTLVGVASYHALREWGVLGDTCRNPGHYPTVPGGVQ